MLRQILICTLTAYKAFNLRFPTFNAFILIVQHCNMLLALGDCIDAAPKRGRLLILVSKLEDPGYMKGRSKISLEAAPFFCDPAYRLQ